VAAQALAVWNKDIVIGRGLLLPGQMGLDELRGELVGLKKQWKSFFTG
jgi:hypothetical protein